MTEEKPIRSEPRSLKELVGQVIDPVMTRRAGINTLLLAAWAELVGQQFAICTKPDRIVWPKPRAPVDRDQPDADSGAGATGFHAGVLTVACDGPHGVFFMHERDRILERVNRFFGFPAICEIRLVQKPVATRVSRMRPIPDLRGAERERLEAMISEIDDPKIRAALLRLAATVAARRQSRDAR